MITTYLTLYTSCIIAIIIYAGFISKRYAELTFPFLQGKKIDFDVSIDRMKLFFTSIFFSFSILLFKSFTKLKFDNILTYNIGISLILILIIFFIWLDVKKIASLKNNETEKIASLKKENLVNNNIIIEESITNNPQNDESNLCSEPIKLFDNSDINNSGKSKTLDFSLFLKEKKTLTKIEDLLNENNFYPKKRNLKPIELNYLILKLVKLNIFKYNYNQYEMLDSAYIYFSIEGKGNYSKLKNKYERDEFTQLDDERFRKLSYLDEIKQ